MMVSASATAYVNMIVGPSACTLNVPPDFEWGSDLIETQFKPTAAPIFILKLNVNEKGAYYSTDPALFEVSLS